MSLMGSYYDIDAIIAEGERVPAKFNNDVYNLGYLNPGTREKDIKEETMFDVPYWLGSELKRFEDCVTMQAPAVYQVNKRYDMQAEPAAFNLGRTPYYYELGVRVAVSMLDDDLAKLMEESFLLRFRAILDRSQNMRNTDVSKYTSTLAEVEKRLFQAGYSTSVAVEAWKRRQNTQIASGAARKRRKVLG